MARGAFITVMTDIVKSDPSSSAVKERSLVQGLIFWVKFGISDFRMQYRKTFVGPFWPLLLALVWAAGLGLVFRAMSSDEPHYFAYVVVGISTFGFISSCINSGKVFYANANFLLSINNPLYTHVIRMWAKHVCFYLMQLAAYFVAYYFSAIELEWTVLLVIPALIILSFTSVWVVFLIGIIVTRFRDIENLMQALMRFLFFTSPVFWSPGRGTTREVLSTYNPVSYFLAIIREPLLGREPTLFDWGVTLSICIVGAIITFVLYHKVKNKLVFWL